MPKEVIYDRNGPFVVTEAGDEIRTDHPDFPREESLPVLRRAVHVGWSKDRYVEVGVGAFSAATEFDSDAHFTDLDRDGINRLIRALRKARDQAYGADA